MVFLVVMLLEWVHGGMAYAFWDLLVVGAGLGAGGEGEIGVISRLQRLRGVASTCSNVWCKRIAVEVVG